MPSNESVQQEIDRVVSHIDRALDYLREGDIPNAELCLIDAGSLCEVELARAVAA